MHKVVSPAADATSPSTHREREHVEQQPTTHESKSLKIATYNDVDKRSAKVDTEAEQRKPSRPSFFYRQQLRGNLHRIELM